MTIKFLCTNCDDELVKEENQLICNTCKSIPAIVKDNIIVYKGFDQKTDFFDKRAINILGQMYSTYTHNTFIDDLNKFNLDASADTLILENDRDYKLFKKYSKIFQSNQFLVLAYKATNDTIDAKYIENIRKLKNNY